MNMPRQSFWFVGACVIMFTRSSARLAGMALIEKMPVLKPALGENGENGVMYYLADATATFFKMMEPVETIKF